MSFAEYAQNFVDATSRLVSGKTINIMNENGCIIASTDKSRIGTFHAGAYKVLSTRREVVITRDTEQAFHGSKEGCNLPIESNGQIVGVIGVAGPPEEIKDLANLLSVYATQYFQIRSDAGKDKLHAEIRMQILLQYIYGRTADYHSFKMDSDIIGLKIILPARILIITAPDTPNEYVSYPRLEKHLVEHRLLHPKQDAYGTIGRHFVALLSRQTEELHNSFCAELDVFLSAKKGLRAAFGSKCIDFENVPSSYQEALFLIEHETSRQISAIDAYSCRLSYYTEQIASQYALNSVSRAIAFLQEEIGAEALRMFLQSASVYYAFNRSVQKASDYLKIHKNTLLHRMGRLYKLLQLDEESDYTKEFFIRLLINRCHADIT